MAKVHTLDGALKPYQLDGVRWLMRKQYALLADDMGLGKSVQAIQAARLLGYQTINIFCPALVRYVWESELQKWWWDSPKVHVVASGDPVPREGIAIMSYDSLLNEQRWEGSMRRKVDLTICDESHYLKGRKSERTRAIYGRYCNGGGVGDRAKRLWCLSGTPSPNDPSELYPMLRFFGAYKKGWSEFLKRYFYAQAMRGELQSLGVKDADGLKALIAPLILRRLKKDVISQLPPLRVSTISLAGDFFGDLAFLKELTPEICVHILHAVENNDWRFLEVPHIATIQRYIGLAKAASTAELVKYELSQGLERIVLFARHTAVIERIRTMIPNSRAIHGQTAEHHRQAFLEEFAAGKLPCLILQINIAKEGLRFKNCVEGLIVEPLWSPELNRQAIMRFDWLDRKNPVNIRFVSLAGSIDEAISRVLSRKALNISKVLT